MGFVFVFEAFYFKWTSLELVLSLRFPLKRRTICLLPTMWRVPRRYTYGGTIFVVTNHQQGMVSGYTAYIRPSFLVIDAHWLITCCPIDGCSTIIVGGWRFPYWWLSYYCCLLLQKLLFIVSLLLFGSRLLAVSLLLFVLLLFVVVGCPWFPYCRLYHKLIVAYCLWFPHGLSYCCL